MEYLKTFKLKLLYMICLQSSLFNQQEAMFTRNNNKKFNNLPTWNNNTKLNVTTWNKKPILNLPTWNNNAKLNVTTLNNNSNNSIEFEKLNHLERLNALKKKFKELNTTLNELEIKQKGKNLDKRDKMAMQKAIEVKKREIEAIIKEIEEVKTRQEENRKGDKERKLQEEAENKGKLEKEIEAQQAKAEEEKRERYKQAEEAKRKEQIEIEAVKIRQLAEEAENRERKLQEEAENRERKLQEEAANRQIALVKQSNKLVAKLNQTELLAKLMEVKNGMEKAKTQNKKGGVVMMGIYNQESNKLKAGLPLNEQDITTLENWLKAADITNDVSTNVEVKQTVDKIPLSETEFYKKSTHEILEYLKKFNWLELRNKMMAERQHQSPTEQWESLKEYTRILEKEYAELLKLSYECQVKSNCFQNNYTQEEAEREKNYQQLQITQDNPNKKAESEAIEDKSFKACQYDYEREAFIKKKDQANSNIEAQSNQLRCELEAFSEKIQQLKNQAVYNETYGKSQGEGLLSPIDYGFRAAGLAGVTAAAVKNFSDNKSVNIPNDTSKEK